ncbi:MAG TPA: tetratricopeptide repeat protein [Candidatus Limnocylindria bacterium]|nr:tetratricopeptide repeat protein [Candidatus Limnocylindria bacterium]
MALWAHRRALGAYFSPDDLIHFERLRGLLPHTATVWRWLSNDVYMGAALARFGADPAPYHLLNWLGHGLNAALVFALARALGAGRPGAALAAGLFGASRLYLPALFQAVGLGELAALTGTILAMLLVLRDHPLARAAALPIFAAALLLKENVALLPAALLVATGRAESLTARARRFAPLLILGVAYFVVLTLGHARSGGARGDAYDVGLGINLFHNLMTYLDWSADLRRSLPDLKTVIDTNAWRVGLWVAAALVAVAVLSARRTRLPAFGLAWFGLVLLPVLPLLHHTYAYYLYAPVAGLAIGLGAAFEAALKRRPWVWLLGGALLAGYVWQSDRLTEQRMQERVPGFDFLRDPFLRKSEVVRRTATDVAGALRGRPASVLIYSPNLNPRFFTSGSGQEMRAGPSTRGAYDIVREVLDHGRALMALYPELDTVAIADRWTREHERYEIFVRRAGANLVHAGRGPETMSRLAGVVIANGSPELAREMLQEAVAAYPESPRLQLQLAYLLDRTGDRAGAMARLRELVRSAPGDTIARQARIVLARLEALR